MHIFEILNSTNYHELFYCNFQPVLRIRTDIDQICGDKIVYDDGNEA